MLDNNGEKPSNHKTKWCMVISSVVCCEITRPEPNTNKSIILIEYFWLSIYNSTIRTRTWLSQVPGVGGDHGYWGYYMSTAAFVVRISCVYVSGGLNNGGAFVHLDILC